MTNNLELLNDDASTTSADEGTEFKVDNTEKLVESA
jgi:hypothetical protein